MKNNLIFLFTFLFCTISFSQNERQITGKITDRITQNPIKGAAILVKETIIGTTSKSQGKYSIKVPNEVTHLVFNYIGYEKLEIKIGNQNVIDVQLVSIESITIEDLKHDEWKKKTEQLIVNEALKYPASLFPDLAREFKNCERMVAEVNRLEEERKKLSQERIEQGVGIRMAEEIKRLKFEVGRKYNELSLLTRKLSTTRIRVMDSTSLRPLDSRISSNQQKNSKIKQKRKDAAKQKRKNNKSRRNTHLQPTPESLGRLQEIIKKNQEISDRKPQNDQVNEDQAQRKRAELEAKKREIERARRNRESSVRDKQSRNLRESQALRRLEEDRRRAETSKGKSDEEYRQMMTEMKRLQSETDQKISSLEDKETSGGLFLDEDESNGYDDFSREAYAHYEENDFKTVTDDPLSTFSIDVDKASYANARRYLNSNQLPPPSAIRIEELINYFQYDYPQPEENQPFSVFSDVTEAPWNSENKLVQIGIKGKELSFEEVPSSNLVFLIDVSGSMSSSNKLPLLKESFKMLVDHLRPNDRVAIVVYAGAAGEILASTSGNHKTNIKAALNQLNAGGSTAGGEGILLAYKIARENFIKNGNNRVILATDGDFNVGTSSEGELVKLIEGEREDGIFLTVLGFGTGNYQDSKMEKIADHGNGNYAYIDNLMEAKKVLVNEMSGTLYTIAKDVKIQVEFNPAQIKSYRLIGYDNRMLENQDFNDDTKDAGELGAGHTVTALYEIVPASSSAHVASTDPLKYQSVSVNQSARLSNELMTVKLRYKNPDEDVSQLISQPVQDGVIAIDQASENLCFAAAVAEFGLLLRHSKFKSDASFQAVLKRAKSAIGSDLGGYRAEFIRLVEVADLLSRE